MTHGKQIDPSNTAVVGLRPSPHLIAGQLDPKDEQLVYKWMALNTAALMDYWDGLIDTIQLGQRLIIV